MDKKRYSLSSAIIDSGVIAVVAGTAYSSFSEVAKESIILAAIGASFFFALGMPFGSLIKELCVFIAKYFFVPSGEDSTIIIGILLLGAAGLRLIFIY